MPDDVPPRRYGTDVGWGFAILAAVILMIIVGWGWSGEGRGWGRSNEMADIDAARSQFDERAGHAGGNRQHAVERTLIAPRPVETSPSRRVPR